jgi:hypothetical protein
MILAVYIRLAPRHYRSVPTTRKVRKTLSQARTGVIGQPTENDEQKNSKPRSAKRKTEKGENPMDKNRERRLRLMAARDAAFANGDWPAMHEGTRRLVKLEAAIAEAEEKEKGGWTAVPMAGCPVVLRWKNRAPIFLPAYFIHS